MRVLKLTLGKKKYLQIFLKFQIFSVKRPDEPNLMFERAQSYVQMVKWHVRMGSLQV
jgi:hypothetical protein